MATCRRVPVDPIILTCAVRYTLGRESYIVGFVIDSVRSNADRLGNDRQTIARDIADWLDEKWHDHPDRAAWDALRRCLEDA